MKRTVITEGWGVRREGEKGVGGGRKGGGRREGGWRRGEGGARGGGTHILLALSHWTVDHTRQTEHARVGCQKHEI